MKKVLFFLFLIYTQSLYSQKSNDSTNLIFGTIGVGGFGSEKSGGLDGLISLNFQKKSHQIKIRYIGASEFNLFGPHPLENFNDIGVLYGRVSNYKNIQFSISGGFGIVTGDMRGAFLYNHPGWFTYSEYEKRQIFTYGMPIEVELNYNPLDFLGLGIAVFGNFNPESSLWGINLMLKFGKVKPNRNFIR